MLVNKLTPGQIKVVAASIESIIDKAKEKLAATDNPIIIESYRKSIQFFESVSPNTDIQGRYLDYLQEAVNDTLFYFNGIKLTDGPARKVIEPTLVKAKEDCLHLLRIMRLEASQQPQQ